MAVEEVERIRGLMKRIESSGRDLGRHPYKKPLDKIYAISDTESIMDFIVRQQLDDAVLHPALKNLHQSSTNLAKILAQLVDKRRRGASKVLHRGRDRKMLENSLNEVKEATDKLRDVSFLHKSRLGETANYWCCNRHRYTRSRQHCLSRSLYKARQIQLDRLS
jgi:hypothetical protein